MSSPGFCPGTRVVLAFSDFQASLCPLVFCILMPLMLFVFTKTKGLFSISEYVSIKDISPHRIKLIAIKVFYEGLLLIKKKIINLKFPS